METALYTVMIPVKEGLNVTTSATKQLTPALTPREPPAMTVCTARPTINATAGYVEDRQGIAVQLEMNVMTGCVMRPVMPARRSLKRPVLHVMTVCTATDPMSVLVEAAFMAMIPV
jgi:hypothetical protein